MLRQRHRLMQSGQLVRDTLLVGLAFVLAYALRVWLSTRPGHCPWVAPSPSETVLLALVGMAVWPWAASSQNLYQSRRMRPAWAELFDVAKALAMSFVSLTTLTYFLRESRYSRATFLLWALLSWALLVLARLTQKGVLMLLRRRGLNLRHALVVGAGPLAQSVLKIMRAERHMGLLPVGVISLKPITQDSNIVVEGVPVVGHIGELSACVARFMADQVLLALPIEAMHVMPVVMDQLSRETVDVRLVPDFYQYVTLCGSIEEFMGMPMVTLQATPMVGMARTLKRLFDISLATVLLAITMPVWLVSALLIALQKQGPILYKQRRIGLDSQPFDMLKFRTMHVDAERHGAKMTQINDPRVTTLGLWLRRLSIDELPQLINVLRGEMSLVGPRPEQPHFTQTFVEQIPRYALRHKIKAGMTGWAQINGLRGNTSIVQRIEMDLYYIENWSLLLDVKILVRTMLGGFLSRNAY